MIARLGMFCRARCPIIALIALFGLLGVGRAAENGTSIWTDSDYLVTSFETENGLPENSATAMVQTPDGYLWFGTFNGLVRFDGVKFTVFDPSNTPQLPGYRVIGLHLEASGRLWVSTDRGLVAREGDRWRSYGKEQGWAGNYARTFSESAGVVCITSFDGQVARARDGVIEALPEPPGIRGSGYLGHVDRDGRVWVAQGGYFGRWDGKAWTVPALVGNLTNGFQGLALARDGGMLAVRGNRVLRLEQGNLLSETVLPAPIVDVWSVGEDTRGNVWITSSSAGLHRVSPLGEHRSYSSTNGLSYNSLRFTFEDREGNLWVGSSGGGLMRFKEHGFVSYGIESGLQNRNVKAVAEESQGSYLLGTYGKGLARLAGGRASRVAESRANDLGSYVQALLVDRVRGETWIGTYKDNLRIISGGALRIVPSEETGGSDIGALFQDSQGRIWIGGDRTVSVHENGKYTPQKPRDGVDLAGAVFFAENPADRTIWAGSGNGLFRLGAGEWGEVKGPGGASLPEISCLSFDPDGSLWVGSGIGGVLRLRAGRWSAVSEAQGLPSRAISSMLDDGLGYWWIGCNRGVARVARRDLEAMADGKPALHPIQLFGLSDGMASIECSGGFQSTALKDSRNRLWFATLKGVSVVDPAKIRLNTNLPPVLFERLTYLDRAGTQRELRLSGQSIVPVPAGSRELEIHYSALSYTAPEKMRFAWMLRKSGQWTDAAGRRSVVFHTPPPGPIHVRVKAANNDGFWNENGASIVFDVRPFFWQSLWFRSLAMAGTVGAAAFAAWRIPRRNLQIRLRRMERERALDQERARLGAVMEGTSDFVGFADLDGNVLYINPAGRRLVGLGESEDVRTRKLSDFHPPWAADIILRDGLPAARRDGVWAGETALLRRDGAEVPVSQALVFHRMPDGQSSFISTIARDVTERKRAEDALRMSEERLQMALRSTMDGIWDWNVRTNDVFISPRLKELLGFSDDELPNRFETFTRQIHPEDLERAMNAIARYLRTRRREGLEVRFCRKSGDYRWFDMRGEGFWDGSGEPTRIVGCMTDVTERKKAAEEHAELEAQFRQAQKMEAIGTLAGGIAHDFNNILTAIVAYTDLAKSDATGESVGYLENVLRACGRAKDLVSQILTFSRRQKQERRPTRLQPVVREALELLRSTLPASVEIESDIRDDAPVVFADSGQIHQVLMNLCTNAAHAMRDRAGKLEVSLDRWVVEADATRLNPELRAGVYSRLRVRDNGVGIPPEALPRIFEPFFTTKSQGEGTGLGLAVAHGIVKECEGSIAVSSELGKGTVFTVLLPEYGSAIPLSQAADAAPLPGSGQRILVVDDEAAICEVAGKILKRLGYVAIVRTDPVQALATFRGAPNFFDLVITDLNMPKLRGPELAKEILLLRPEQAILLTTGLSGEWTNESARQAGLRGLILKPYSANLLGLAVHEILRGETPP